MLRILLPLLFLTAVTLNVAFASCTEKKLHSIKKREAENWCTSSGCTTCINNDCHQTCRGFMCGACPSGNCCNGTNCNACYNSHCCSTPPCNYCIATCRHACFNETACLDICVPQCQNGVHDVLVVQPNSITPGQQKVTVYIKGLPYKGTVTGGQIPTTNKTAVVRIDGTDQPATVLTLLPAASPPIAPPITPPIAPTTATPSVPCSNNPSNGPYQNNYPNNNRLQPGCCYVVHPQQCYNTLTYPYYNCHRRTHQECSNLCSSNFVHLVQQPQQQHRCHYINTYPYVYCGQHSVQNCDSCYVCNGQYNPYSCVQQNGCSSSCRQTFAPPSRMNTQMQPAMGSYQQQYYPTF